MFTYHHSLHPLLLVVNFLCSFGIIKCNGFVCFSSDVSFIRYRNSLRKSSSTATTTSEHEYSTTDEATIQIFDNVFSSYACEELVYLTQDHSERGNDGSSVFTRPPNNESPLTPIEHAIDSFLTSVNDKTQKVEYWSRSEYINIDAHADIDEEQLEDDDILRCPQMGHVLYLEVKENLKGPTCVFPNKRYGWDERNKNGIVVTKQEEAIDLVVVPAVESRVLRFPGSAMHSVPYPANRWLLSQDEERNLRQEEDRDEDSSDNNLDEDDLHLDDEINYDEEDDDIERSVLLFNTWPDDEAAPKGVNGDYVTGSMPEGIELSDDDMQSYLKSEETQRLFEWEEEYGVHSEKIRCNPPNVWERIDIDSLVYEQNEMNQDDSIVRIGLMGNQNRRLWRNKLVKLIGSKQVMERVLNNPSIPSFVKLQPDSNDKSSLQNYM